MSRHRNHVAKLTTIRCALLAPFMIMLIFFAAFQATRDWQDLIALLVMGTLGIFMKRFGWSRPALLIGYFLAPRLEPKIYQASQVYGWSFFERPIVIALLLLTVASIYMAWRFSPNAVARSTKKTARTAPARKTTANHLCSGHDGICGSSPS